MPETIAEALQARDGAALERLLAPDAVFHSPVRTYPGRPLALRLLSAVANVLEEIELVSRFTSGDEAVTFVTATVGGEALDGCVRELKAGAQVSAVTLMVRPLAALEIAIERMQAALE